MKRLRPPAYIFVSPATFPAVKEAQKLLPQPPDTVIAHPRSVLDALSAIDSAGRAILTISASESKHLKLATTLAARLKTQIKAGLVKIVVVSSVQHEDLPKLLKKHGCEEVLSPELTDKAIKLKWLRLMSMVELAWGKTPQGRADAGAAKPGVGDGTRDKAKKSTIKAVASLKIADDCWIVRGKAFKFIQDKWIIRIDGPSPSAGRWVKGKDQPNAWVWTPRDASNPFVSEGVWTFYGKQPENKGNAWVFVGEIPRLAYSQNGKEVCNRFEGAGEGTLKIARNSRAALKKSALIASSYEQGMKGKKPPSFQAQTTEKSPQKSSQAAPDLGGVALDFGEPQSENPEFDEQPDLAIGPPSPPFADGKFGSKTVNEVERLNFFEEILEELGPKPEMFYVVSNRKDCLALIRESAHLHAPAIIWTRGQKFRKTTQISHFAKESGSLGIELPQGSDWTGLMKSLSDVHAQEIFVNANLGRTAIFFKQTLAQLREGKASVEVSCPEKIYEVQRRKHLRSLLRAGEDAQACIALDGDKAGTFWKLMDLSAGGLCVSRASAPASLAAKLKRGARIESVSFKIYGQEIECDARVAWIKRKKGKGATEDLVIGIQFDHITHADREGIRLYVMEENYAYLKNGMARMSGNY